MDRINEESTAIYTAYLKDEEGEPILTASLSAATLTLHDPERYEIINSRQGQNVLNANNVTIADVEVDATIAELTGLSVGDDVAKVTWAIQAADTVVLDVTKVEETRVAQFKFTWTTGQHHHPYTFTVVNLGRVPAT